MKIAVLGAKGIPPKQGGVEHQCAEIYPRIVKLGHTVDLYGRSSYTDLPAFESYDFNGVKVVSLPGSGLRGFDALATSAIGALKTIGQGYDVVHFHALGPSLFTWLPRLASSSKIVVTCQGLDWQRDKWGKSSSALIHTGEKAAVRFAHEIIVVSKELQSYFWTTYGRKTTYIPNGPAEYAKSDPAFTYGKSLGLNPGKYIVYVGRLVPEKCPDLLIRAFQSLRPEGWKLVFVGGDSDTVAFASELSEMAASDSNIVFTGELRGGRLAEIVRGAGLFVLPSNLEGLPLAMLEAMKEGIPVLGSSIPPHQQLLSEGRGLMFQTGNVDSCIRELKWATQHPQEIQAMADKAQNYVNIHYAWEDIAVETLHVYEKVMLPAAVATAKPLETSVFGK